MMMPARQADAEQRPELDLDGAIVDIVSRGAVKVPPYPAVAMKVQELVQREDYGLEDVAKLVASDQTLAADALRCANSALYNRGSTVTSLNHAISRIGAKEMARIAIASGLGTQARKPGPLAALKRRVWLEALAAAALSQELAKARGLDPEEAFVCGLLHDFGKMIAIACLEEVAAAHPRERPRPTEAWLEVVERYHIELGLVLAAQWKLPPLVSDVISLHHAAETAGAAEARLVEVIAAVDDVVGLLGDHVWLTPEDLGVVAALSTRECEVVARLLDGLPGFIASFEGSAARAPGGSLVEPASPERFIAGPTPAEFDVTVTLGRERHLYRATAIAPSTLMVRGTSPLPESMLLKLDLASTPPLACWGTAKLSWPEGGEFTVLLQPFALDRAARTSWQALVGPRTAAS